MIRFKKTMRRSAVQKHRSLFRDHLAGSNLAQDGNPVNSSQAIFIGSLGNFPPPGS